MSQPVDVVVVGGGPAGAAIAIALTRGFHGSRSVVVLERSGYEHPRIGDTLPPEARVPLASLGVWDRFLEQRHGPAPGTLSVWGQARPRREPFHLQSTRQRLAPRSTTKPITVSNAGGLAPHSGTAGTDPA